MKDSFRVYTGENLDLCDRLLLILLRFPQLRRFPPNSAMTVPSRTCDKAGAISWVHDVISTTYWVAVLTGSRTRLTVSWSQAASSRYASGSAGRWNHLSKYWLIAWKFAQDHGPAIHTQGAASPASVGNPSQSVMNSFAALQLRGFEPVRVPSPLSQGECCA